MTYFGTQKKFTPNISMSVKKIIIIVIIFAAVMINTFHIYSTRHYFSPENWNSSSQDDRQYMLESFKDQYKNSNITKKGIIEILGNDTEYCYGYTGKLKKDNNLVYDFGQKKNAFFKYSGNIALVITFDELDFVKNIDIMYYTW